MTWSLGGTNGTENKMGREGERERETSDMYMSSYQDNILDCTRKTIVAASDVCDVIY